MSESKRELIVNVKEDGLCDLRAIEAAAVAAGFRWASGDEKLEDSELSGKRAIILVIEGDKRMLQWHDKPQTGINWPAEATQVFEWLAQSGSSEFTLEAGEHTLVVDEDGELVANGDTTIPNEIVDIISHLHAQGDAVLGQVGDYSVVYRTADKSLHVGCLQLTAEQITQLASEVYERRETGLNIRS